MNKGKLKIGTAFVLGIAFLTLVIMLLVLGDTNKSSFTSISKLETWNRSILDKGLYEIKLPAKVYRSDGENAKIYTLLPEDFEKEQTLCFWTEYQDVKVYLEDTLIYTNIKEGARFGKATFSQWNFVNIQQNSQGKKLLIFLQCPYNKFEFQLQEVVYGTSNEVHQWIVKTYGFNQLLDYALLGVGIVLIILAMFQNGEWKQRICQCFFGMTAVLIGLWMRTSMKGVPLYWFEPYTANLLGIVCVLLIPVALALYVRLRVSHIKRLVKVCDLVLGLELVIAIMVLMLQVMGIKDAKEIIVVAEIEFLVTAIGAVTLTAYYYAKEKEPISELTIFNAYLLFVAGLSEYLNLKNINIQGVRIDTVARVCIVLILVFELILFVNQLRKKEQLKQITEQENKNLQINILTNHIQPHFVLNTLGAIRSMIRRDPNKAYDLLYDFSKYLRKNMGEKDYSKKVPFQEEIDYIQTYLKLEKVRFEERVQVEYDVQVNNFWILPLTIQPLVENAVKHGLLKKKEGGTVRISTKETKDDIIIVVEDDGVGFDMTIIENEGKQATSIGLRSSFMRLQNEMNAICKVESDSTEQKAGTRIEVRIPKKEVTKDEDNYRR